MSSYSKVIDDILDRLEKAEERTLPFSSLLKSSSLSRRDLLYFFDRLERGGVVTHNTDFWGDPKSYTLLVDRDVDCNCTVERKI
jgi:hypothetical protein